MPGRNASQAESGSEHEPFREDLHILIIRKRRFGGIPLRICDLRLKEVINLCDGKRLGYITDMEFDCKTGCIMKFIIPGPAPICGFLGRDTEYIIPFCAVEQIGEDFVLVKVITSDCVHKCKP